MADLTRTVEVIFGAIDETSAGLTSVGNSINSFNNSLLTVAQPLSDISEKVLKTEAAIATLGIAFAGFAVNESSKLTESLEEIGSLVNATPDDINVLRQSVQDFALSSTSNFDQIEQAVYDTTSALGSTEQALAVLEVAEKGAIVGATDLASASNVLTNVLNAYGLVSDDAAQTTRNAEEVMAALFVTVQNGKTTLPELSDNIGKVASTSAAAKVDIETVGAAIAALTGAGIGTEQSMTLLNAVLKELLQPSKELQTALGGLSVTSDGLPAILDRLRVATGGNAEQFFALFNSTEAAKGAMILANDSAGKFKGTLDAMPNSIQAFNTNMQQMAGGVDDSTQQLQNAITIMFQNVGLKLEDGSVGILDAFKNLFAGLSVSINEGAFDPVFAQLNEFNADLSAQIQGIANALPAALDIVDFSGLVDSFEALGVSIGGIFDGLDLTQPEDLAQLIQLVIDSFTSLNNVVSGIIDVWSPVIQLVTGLIGEFNKLDPEVQKVIGAILGASQVFTTFSPVIGLVGNALEIGGKALQNFRSILSDPTIYEKLLGLGKAGLVTGAGIGGYEAGTSLAKGIDNFIANNTEAHHSLGTLIADFFGVGDAAAAAATSTITFDEATVAANKAAYEHALAVEKNMISAELWTDSVNAVGEALTGNVDKMALYEQAVARSNDATLTAEQRGIAFAAAVQLAADIQDEANASQEAYTALIAEAEKTGKAYTTYWEDDQQKIKYWTSANDEATKSVEQNLNALGKLTEEQKLVIENTQEMALKLEELASNERIKSMEFKAELDIAKVEAAAAVLTGILDSTEAFFNSSAEIVSSFVEGILNSYGSTKQFFIESIKQEMDLRQQEIDLQYAVLESQERMFQTQLDAYRDGVDVRFTSDGLDADLKQLMVTILKRIRTEIVGDYTQFLLASGT